MSDDVLGSIATIVMGQSPPGETCNNRKEGIPLLNGPTEFGPHHPTPVQYTTDARKIAEPGDILFCVRGSTTGRMNWADQRYAIGRGIAAIRHKKGIEYQPFLRGLIEFYLPGLLAQATGSTFPNISFAQLANLGCSLPSIADQRSIARILGTLDDKIDLNRRMNETLEAIAQALFKSWFVDFDPVRAKVEGQDQGLSKEVADLLPSRLQDSSLGIIPEGWIVGTLGDVAKNLRRSIRPDDISSTTPYIGLEHMPRRCIALSDWGIADNVESNKFLFKRGEILFGKLRPYFHKVGVAPIDGVCSTDILIVVPDTPEWFGFVLGHISSLDFVNHTDASSTGTKMPRTSWQDMANYRIALPPKRLAAIFTDQVRPLIERIISNIHESHTLATIRDMLLPRLLSGELQL